MKDLIALRAKLAEAERERQRLSGLLGEWISAASHLSFGRVAQEPTPERLREAIEQADALRSRLAKTEAVVEDADMLIALLVQGEVLVPVVQREVNRWRALRALDDDSPVGVAATAEGAGCPCDCRLCAIGHHVLCSRCLGRAVEFRKAGKP